MIPRYSLLIIGVAASILGFSRKADANRVDHQRGGLDVFLIAGQSNATGMADDPSTSPKVPKNNVLQFYQGKISSGDDPVGNAYKGSAWPQFGITYYKITGHRVLFVPASLPGTSMTLRGDFFGKGHWDESGRLFGAATTMLEQALRAAGPRARFAGVLWDQGEADAFAINLKYETAADYKAALERLIARFRQKFGQDVPFFIFQTGSTAVDKDRGGFSIVRGVQVGVSRENAGNAIVFRDADTFQARSLVSKDGNHYSQAGYNLMGCEGALGVAAYYGEKSSIKCK